MKISIALMRNNLDEPLKWAVVVKETTGSPAIPQSFHDTRREALIEARPLRDKIKSHKHTWELFE